MFRPRIRCRVLSCRDRCRRRNDDFSGEKIRKNINDRLLTPESVRLAAFKRQFGLMSIFWTQKVKLFYAALLANNSH